MPTFADLENPSITPEDKVLIQSVLDRYMECDVWAKKALKNTGILLTSHPGNRAFLKASIETHKKTGYWIVLGYDNYLNPKRPDITYEQMFPARDVMDMVDTFIMPHHQTWGGVPYPYFWILKFGIAAMSGFEYIYCANGDCVLEKPENFNRLFDLLGDNDIFPIGYEENGGRAILNTTGIFARREALLKMMNHFESNFIPYENYERTCDLMGNCEGRMAVAAKDLGIKIAFPEKNPFNTQLHRKGGTWFDTLGFRHIHAEFGYAYKHKKEFPELKYFDERYMNSEYEKIKEYWKDKESV